MTESVRQARKRRAKENKRLFAIRVAKRWQKNTLYLIACLIKNRTDIAEIFLDKAIQNKDLHARLAHWSAAEELKRLEAGLEFYFSNYPLPTKKEAADFLKRGAKSNFFETTKMRGK